MPDKTLSVRQRKFLKALQKYDLVKAYVKAYGSKKDRLANQKNASAVYRYIKRTYDLATLLDEYGLGLSRVFGKYDELLDATKPVISDGKIVDSFPDNIVQFNAAKEVAGLHGASSKREAAVNITDNRKQSIIVQVAAQSDIPHMREEEEEIKLKFLEDIKAQIK